MVEIPQRRLHDNEAIEAVSAESLSLALADNLMARDWAAWSLALIVLGFGLTRDLPSQQGSDMCLCDDAPHQQSADVEVSKDRGNIGTASSRMSPREVIEAVGEPQIVQQVQANLKEKLAVIEEVRADLNAEGITVPGIVVCGEQSAGEFGSH